MKILKSMIFAGIILFSTGTVAGTGTNINNITYTYSLETEEDLREYAKRFLDEKYNMKLQVPITIEKLDKNINGLFTYRANEKRAVSIKMSKELIEKAKENKEFCNHDIERTLIHELTHYSLYERDLDFKDGEETFENENYMNGGRSNSGSPSRYLVTKLYIECCE